MDEGGHFDALRQVLVQAWSLPEDVDASRDRLLAALADRVSELLDKDMHRLSTAMYTLDIDESRFQDALDLRGVDTKATAVAELILERELQKILTRRRYEQMKRNSTQDEAEQPVIDVRHKRLPGD
ncbi:MAG: hypothetical protein VCD00_04200 [Candidatus Hydrogenedentota bacterium]